MVQLAAFLICIAFISWLFYRDHKLRPMASGGLWVAFVWITIVGSRPVSGWFGAGIEIENLDDYLEGSPLDRNVFLILIILGAIILLRRQVTWNSILSLNRWFFAYFIYCGISIIWSDYAFLGFKRWIKDLGNLVMVLIILSEDDPVQAVRAVFVRYSSLVIPLSLVLIRYFPQFGRYYNKWSHEPSFCGVATEKNTLGGIVFVCGLFLLWDLIETKSAQVENPDRIDMVNRVVLLLLVLLLIIRADSSTALVCLTIGAAILLFSRFDIFKRQVKHLGTYTVVVCLLAAFLYLVPGIPESMVKFVGRDLTFTGRTDLWAELLSEHINPVLGTGYQTFWQGPIAEHYFEQYSFHPNQAHNGYLETYLNEGLFGAFLLLAMIGSVGKKLKEGLLFGDNYAILRFSLFIAILFYNWTEASFNKLSVVWIVTMVAFLNSIVYVEFCPYPTRVSWNVNDDLDYP